ncbi:MAG: succinylglutamate desuccinylase/aspartoacylase family protein [Pseudomonadota bacterium]
MADTGTAPSRDAFVLNGEIIKLGSRVTVKIPTSFLSDHTPMSLTTHVIHGRKDGPTVFVSGAIHGDEIIGVEIIQRLNAMKVINQVRGTLILIPVVNAYGFVSQSRYLPDRRDLNRSFPGSANGPLASQLAHRFMTDIVAHCDLEIDLHTGAIHRANLPQIRAELDNPEVLELAQAFGASIMLNAQLRDGSLREAAQQKGCKILLYEAGEALRYDETAIRIGVRGVLSVLRHVGMLTAAKSKEKGFVPIRSDSSHWLRAPIGGVMRARKTLGDRVRKGQVVADISDPLGELSDEVTARYSGIVIGRTNLPVVNRGDALFHVARVKNASDAEERIDALDDEVDDDPLLDGFEIV